MFPTTKDYMYTSNIHGWLSWWQILDYCYFTHFICIVVTNQKHVNHKNIVSIAAWDKLYSANDLLLASNISFSLYKAFIWGNSCINSSNLSSLEKYMSVKKYMGVLKRITSILNCQIQFDFGIPVQNFFQLIWSHTLQACQSSRIIRLCIHFLIKR